jgi:hypothetical protein
MSLPAPKLMSCSTDGKQHDPSIAPRLFAA